MRLAAAALVAVTLAACGREETVDERCRRTIDHVKAIVAADAKAAGRGKKVVGGAAEIASMSVCTHEGLSPAQADCITAARDLDQLLAVGECPAIREKKPRWLVLPPKKLLRGSEPEAGEEAEPRQ
ncbi:MAG TPA: hypothetical protein VFU21_31760 [Kofleriaceae bacterium]|nr:hypothetical protein [Kofleriaceae bacterium]